MKKLSSLILFVLVALMLYSCSTLFSSAGNNNVMGDSTFTNRSIVGTSNTPGSPRIIDYQELKLATGGTPNTTGPSPAPQDMADYVDPNINKNGVSVVDMRRFIQLSTFNSLTEVQLSTIVLSKTKNKSISSYASKIISDQNRIGEELKSISNARKLGEPDLNGRGNEDLTKKIENLNQASASQLDQVYLKLIKKEHRNAIQILEQGAKFKDSRISDFSTRYLSVIRAQQKIAASL